MQENLVNGSFHGVIEDLGSPEAQAFVHQNGNGSYRSCLLASLLFLILGTGCSVQKYAINKLGDALAQSGTTFASDEDPELVRQAIPFSLKLVESLLAESPRHEGLLLAASRGFTQYSYAFVQQEADEIEEKDLTAATELRNRAKRLYLRARNYGLRGLETRHANFEAALRKEPQSALRAANRQDVSLMYWTAASWASAISLSKDNPDLIADLPIVEALVDRTLQLEEDFDQGALHSLLVSFETARHGAEGDPLARAKKHFDRAMALSKGQMVSPLVSLAETVSVKKQNVQQFRELLNQALSINVDLRPEWRLENLVMQRRARWLLARTDQLFLVVEPQEEKAK
jgi:predicted anti-sigma-YlaC factor YlaD